MDISKFQYHLPKKLIANSPVVPRDHSNLLILNRNSEKITHDKFFNLPKYLTNNDVLVFNKTKVFPARLFGQKDTGGKIEILLLEDFGNGKWKAIHRGKLSENAIISFKDLSATVVKKEKDSVILKFNQTNEELFRKLEKIGYTPLPPYIKNTQSENEVRSLYQTVYAKDIGSAAAPTAGFHFTKNLLENLQKLGVQTEFVTLHVGLGTFAPVKEEKIEDHQIHSEKIEVEAKTLKKLIKFKKEGKRIIAVGTTTTRVLESLQQIDVKMINDKLKSSTELFIYPPYQFKFVDAMITNFHLPKSTLLALVSAFVSEPNTNEKFIDFQSSLIGKAYQEAIEKNYRFYSFGDAMLIE